MNRVMFPFYLILLLLVCPFAAGLEEYHLEITPAALDSIFAHPYSSTVYPAVLTCASGSSSCYVRLRGRSTLVHPKKNWSIIISDHDLLGRNRLNLNAEYMDLTMMRDCIAMRASELMGLPSSRTVHVKFYINGEYMGVYLDTERVDSDYFERHGYDQPVALFKGFTMGARFMWLPSGVTQDPAYSPCAGSEINGSQFRNFIDCINSGVNPLPVDLSNVIGYYAVALALVENDVGSNNYYIGLGSDGMWRVYPWDRDLCLGGGGDGAFYPHNLDDQYLTLFRRNPLYQKLIQSESNKEIFDFHIAGMAELLCDEIPLLMDSIYQEIRFDLYEDPMTNWTPEEIDQAFEDIIWFAENRGLFLKEKDVTPQATTVIDMLIPEPWLDSGENTIVTIHSDSTYDTVYLQWLEYETIKFLKMVPVHGDGPNKWSADFYMPDGPDYCPFVFFFIKNNPDLHFSYYPSYSLEMFYLMPAAHPGTVRIAPGCISPADESVLSILSPMVFGPTLWAVPIVNVGSDNIDISRCAFVDGNTPNRVFVPSETVILSGDTVFLTNSFQRFESEFPERDCLGNFAGSCPDGGTITMLNPGWSPIWEKPVPLKTLQEPAPVPVILTEICFMVDEACRCGDWIEFYNSSDTLYDFSSFVLSDTEGNRFMVPEDTWIEPGGFFIFSRREVDFNSCYPECNSPLSELEFGLDSDIDNLSVFDRNGRLLYSVRWDEFLYPLSERPGILDLIAPTHPVSESSSWELEPFPGSPGEPNRLWSFGSESLSLGSIFPNPCSSGEVCFEYTSMTLPIRAFVMDLSGRIVRDSGILENPDGMGRFEMQDSPVGLYFLVLQSAGKTVAGKFTIL